MSDGYKHGGLRNKYKIEKTNGHPIDPQAEYFVLRVDADPHARAAVMAYADSVQIDNPKFAADLYNWLLRLNREDNDE